MAGTKVSDVLLTSGQNEGIERAVLPMPQLASVINMRLRKGSRWGKRFGHTRLSTTNLGSGSGIMRSAGGGKGGANTCFALVDDRCSVYDQTAAAFVNPTSTATTAPMYRVQGAASGWLPDTSFFPVPAQSPKNQTTTPCGGAYAFGYLWTVIQYTELASTDKKLRLVATDPSDQTVVRIDDFSASTPGFGGNTYPKLVVVGSTLILTYFLTTGAGTSLIGRSLASIGAAWSAESILVAAGVLGAYDASSYDATRFAIAVAGLFGSSVSLLTTAFGVSATQAIVDPSGNPLTDISVVGAGAEVYVGYACSATPATKVRVFTTNLAGTVGTATVSASAKRPLLALLSGGGVRVVHNEVVTAGSFGTFAFRDVSSAAVAGFATRTQSAAYPISIPFTIGSTVYVWAKTEVNGLSYATLFQLPSLAALASPAGNISCPIEMSVQDYLVSPGVGLTETDSRGLPVVTQLGTTAAYTVPVPTLYSQSSTIATGHDFRILQAKHYTDTDYRRSVQAIYADSSAVLPMGALTRVDDRGATEEGFLHSPTVVLLTPAAGAGTLTPSSDYYYTAIYKSRNSNGRTEVSAPSAPVKVTMAAGQNQNTVTLVGLGATARANVSVEIYRTLSNGQTFYLAAVVDSAAGLFTYLDQLPDATIATQQAVYTQVGQTLANAFPPPSRFGCVGGQRLFLGGLIRPDIVQASKLIFGDQSPSFADSDAFRIVLPAACTGVAWMDVLVMFTAEGIYIASGDGPDDAGIGDFGALTRMPYELGCIEPRSIIVVDDGCFFQTARGLYLLPRGFGAPVPAGDNVQDALASSPVITGCAVLTKATEQSVHWTCAAASGSGARIVYDLAQKAWVVDTTLFRPCGTGQWSSNEVVLFGDLLASVHGPHVTNSAFADDGSFINVQLTTGHLRPFGVLSEGVISKIQVLAELRSACTVTVNKTTEWGNFGSDRTFALAAGDYQIGDVTATEIELGKAELRDASRLQISFSEGSTSEGLAFIAMSLEHEQGEGLKRVFDLSRVT